MIKTTWMTIGTEAELRIAEFRVGPNANTLRKTYQQAKEESLHELRTHISPYLERIHELEADHFQDKGRLPQLKAWSYGPYLVFAKTKKRAAELVGKSRCSFNACFTEADGDWWYEYAGEEGLWRKDENGVHRRALGRELATSLRNAAMEPYLSMPLNVLRQLAGQTVRSQGVSVHGTSYTVEIEIGTLQWGSISIYGDISDDLDWINRFFRCESRIVTTVTEAAANWQKEGF